MAGAGNSNKLDLATSANKESGISSSLSASQKLRYVRSALLSPINMFAQLDDYQLERRLSDPTQPVIIRCSLYVTLREAQDMRTGSWRLAYWIISISMLSTLGTALFGTAASVLAFTQDSPANKALTTTLAVFGIILSLLKGTGLPGSALSDYNKSNGIVDRIRLWMDGYPGSTPPQEPPANMPLFISQNNANSGEDVAAINEKNRAHVSVEMERPLSVNQEKSQPSTVPQASSPALISCTDGPLAIISDWEKIRDENITNRSSTFGNLQVSTKR